MPTDTARRDFLLSLSALGVGVCLPGCHVSMRKVQKQAVV